MLHDLEVCPCQSLGSIYTNKTASYISIAVGGGGGGGGGGVKQQMEGAGSRALRSRCPVVKSRCTTNLKVYVAGRNGSGRLAFGEQPARRRLAVF